MTKKCDTGEEDIIGMSHVAQTGRDTQAGPEASVVEQPRQGHGLQVRSLPCDSPPQRTSKELTAEQEGRALEIREDCRQLPGWASRTIVRLQDRVAQLEGENKQMRDDWAAIDKGAEEFAADSAPEPPAEPIGFVARRKSDGYVCSQFAQPGYRHEIADDFEWIPVWDRPSQPPGASDRQRLEHYWKFCNVLTHPSYMDFQDWLKSLDEDKAERCPSETKPAESPCHTCGGHGRIDEIRIGNLVNIPCPECSGLGE